MGAQYVKSDLLIALYVVSRGNRSLLMPQDVPARDRRMLFFLVILSLVILVCCSKVRRGSNVVPRIFGFFSVGTLLLSMKMGRSILISLLHVVKTVADDFAGEMMRFLSLNQLLSLSRYLLSSAQRGRIFGPEIKMEQSSA